MGISRYCSVTTSLDTQPVRDILYLDRSRATSYTKYQYDNLLFAAVSRVTSAKFFRGVI